VKPRRGFYVRLFTIDEMISIFEIREVLEGLSARRAAKYITEKDAAELRAIFEPFLDVDSIDDLHAYSKADKYFHTFIAEIGSREFLTTILQTLNIVSLGYQNVASEGLIREPDKTIHDHLKIVDAICNHDPEAAEEAMKAHLRKTILQLKENVPEQSSESHGGE
jgi:DNA-binding GntR family transcriptional regulator